MDGGPFVGIGGSLKGGTALFGIDERAGGGLYGAEFGNATGAEHFFSGFTLSCSADPAKVFPAISPTQAITTSRCE